MRYLATALLFALPLTRAWSIEAERYYPWEPEKPSEYSKYFSRWFGIEYPEKAYAMHKKGTGQPVDH